MTTDTLRIPDLQDATSCSHRAALSHEFNRVCDCRAIRPHLPSDTPSERTSDPRGDE